MRKPKQKKEFVVLSEAYYANAPANRAVREGRNVVHDLSFYDGSGGEIIVQWIDLGNAGLSPQITAFDDSWKMFETQRGLFDDLANLKVSNPTIKQFVAILRRRGFKDVTPRVPASEKTA